MLSLVVGLVVAPSVLTVYVSPSGSDRATGRSPREAVRSVAVGIERSRNRPEGSRAIVRLAPGVYPVTQSLSLGPRDRGLLVDGGGVATLDAGITLRGWTSLPADLAGRFRPASRSAVRVAALPLGVNPQALVLKGFAQPDAPGGRRLLYRGRPQPIAQYPNPDENGGWLRMADAAPSGPRRWRMPNDRARQWSRPDEAWFLGYWEFDWAETWEPALKWEEDREWVTLTDAVREPDLFRPMKGRRVRVVNVPEELDRAGEWWIDVPSRRVVFWPPAPLKDGDVTMTVLETPLVRVHTAEDVTMRGVTLRDGSGLGVEVIKSPRTVVADSTVRGFAKTGVWVEDSPGSVVARCHLHDLGETGIALIGGDRATLTPGALTAKDNVIEHYAQLRRTYQPGVRLVGVGHVVEHNRISDAPHNAIHVSGNDHRIEFNDLRRVCLETGDAGAIYMGRDTTMRGIQVRFNRFRELEPLVTTEGNWTNVIGIYLDDLFAGVLMQGNVFEMRGTGIVVGGGHDNTVLENLFLGCQPAVVVDARGQGWARSHAVEGGDWGFMALLRAMRVDQPPYRDRYPALARLTPESVLKALGNRVQRNASFGGKMLVLENELTLPDVAFQGNIEAPTERLTLAQALTKWPAGWGRLPVDQMGPRASRAGAVP